MKRATSFDPVLIVGLSIPVVMVALIAGAIYLPGLMTDIEDPRCDFLYMVGYARDYSYHVTDGRLCRSPQRSREGETESTGDPHLQFFVYRVGDNTNEQLSFEQASTLRLDNSALSPDGFEIAYGRRSEIFFPMWSSRDYRTRYLRKESLSIKLDLEVAESYSTIRSFRFMGWIEE